MSIQDEMGVPSLQEAQKALVMFVSELAKDESGALSPELKERASKVLGDWMMAGILQLAQRGADKPGGES